jgi:glycosyltransferase involved in cell wall biosynthesis
MKRWQIQESKTVWYFYWMEGRVQGLTSASVEGQRLHVVARAHGGDLYEERYRPPYLPFRPEMFEGLERICPVSEDGRRYILDRWPYLKEKTRVHRLGVGASGFCVNQSQKGHVNFFSCSRIDASKRVELVAQAIGEFARRHTDLSVRWRHLGSGPKLGTVHQTVERCFPGNAEVDLPGEVSHESVMKSYREETTDAFIHASKAEGIPVSIMEAMSCGLPVVAAGVHGVPEIVNDETGALLSANPSVDEIVSGLTRVTNSQEAWKTRSLAALEQWRDHFDAASNHRDFAAALRMLVDN